MDKRIYVFAGPNGSGKSTIINHHIEKGLCPDYYICPDNLIDKSKKEIR